MKTIIAIIIMVLHLGLSYFFLQHLQSRDHIPADSFFSLINVSGPAFFANNFKFGLIGYLIMVLYGLIKHYRFDHLKSAALCVFISIGISFLLAINDTSPQTAAPESFWAMMYILVTQKSIFLIVFLFIVIITILGIYYLLRKLFVVTYSSSAMQIQLPGHTVFYFPLYPQVSWQSTGIVLKKGDKVEIDISGVVSPGVLDESQDQALHMKKFIQWLESGSDPAAWKEEFLPAIWPYTGPAGYPERWYSSNHKIPILKNHPIYKKDFYFKEDKFLTIKGATHNRVYGIIQAAGQESPRKATVHDEGYSIPENSDILYSLSQDQYPLVIEARESGTLWLVINDVDMARWDNGGLYFVKLIKKGWFK